MCLGKARSSGIQSQEMGPAVGSGPSESQKKMGQSWTGILPAKGPSHSSSPLGRGQMSSLVSPNTGLPPTSLSLILIFQAPEAGSKAAMGSGVGEGKRRGGEVKDCRTQSPVPSLHRMTVMSLVVLVLSWGSLGLEAATAVVSAGARPLGSGTQGAGGPNSWILGWWGPMP